ncbi:MAG: DNA topoisomerase 3 [Byssovorax sp.]
MTIAVLAEKPAVARDIAAVLGATRRAEGSFEGNGYVVTWAIGHLVALGQPHQIDPAWKAWRLDRLPMLPADWPLVVVAETEGQFKIVRQILHRRDVVEVVCATDAGREGELIFRYIYDAAACKKPVRRLWISSLTPDAIRDGMRRLRSGKDYDRLADAARGRSRADWLVGMNLSRAYTLTQNEDFSVGRVQTPTLAMVVERDLAIRAFVPEDYLEVVATFSPRSGEQYEGTWFRGEKAPKAAPKKPEDEAKKNKGKDAEDDHPTRLPFDGQEAGAIVLRVKTGEARIQSIDSETKKIPPPLLYDLTELQRHCNRLFGWSAKHTLDVAQALYEQKKLISYPRSDSRHLSTDVAQTLPAVVSAVEGPYRHLLAPGTGQRPLGRRFVNDAEVTDHHAIIPTATPAGKAHLSADEQRLYDLICRRLLSAWQPDHVYAITTVITAVRSAPPPGARDPVVDRFLSSGTAIEQVGWKVLDLGGGKKPPRKPGEKGPAGDDLPDIDPSLPGGLAVGQKQTVLDVKAIPKRTRPPPHFTEATLLTAMETAGKTLDEKELSQAMKDTGLGTPATRAAIIETLLTRQYVVRDGKSLHATDKGVHLIEIVHPDVKSPAMTGAWEAKLARMQRGELGLGEFMGGIEGYVREVGGRVAGAGVSSRQGGAPAQAREGGLPLHSPGVYPRAKQDATLGARSSERGFSATATATTTAGGAARVAASGAMSAPQRTPTPSTELLPLLKRAFGFSAFRPYQEAVCQAATEGQDLLLVMPTGAGKSLCYQLPGIARGGTTLVISPLIALMEDQAQKLAQQGFAAERIHSGRDRAASRKACVDYLAGRLDFLFIAPERLRVPGFPEMLAKRKPALIAIDEAHCISHWGHDFRPDYRMLGERLPLLRPAPVIALTATATPLVQDDIIAQLGLTSALRFIHGFRRTNIAIEVVELSPGERPEVVEKLLAGPGRRPAIVYAPTRKAAEDLAGTLERKFKAEAYHAGMDASARERVQTAFLGGQTQVIVATIAFGMGIDKPDVRTIIHAGLPGSLEGYYQEIGRAGRDGLPSRAILMHSYVDQRTHEFFHERDYPDPLVLKQIFDALGAKPKPREALQLKLDMEPQKFDKALEKLWIHGGARMDEEWSVMRGDPDWADTYIAQRNHKLAQLRLMARFTDGHRCRMLDLVRHFGDQEDSGEPCGLCDVCAPDACLTRTFRAPSQAEEEALQKILRALMLEDDQATGKLFRETFTEGTLDRKAFEHLLGALCRAGHLTLRDDSFDKDGQVIHFQRASLTFSGRNKVGSAALLGGVTLGERVAPKKRKAASKRGGGSDHPGEETAEAKRAFFARKNYFAKLAKKKAGGGKSKGGKKRR